MIQVFGEVPKWPYRNGLENRLLRKGHEGSNPSLSAFATLKRGYGATQSAVAARKRAL